jgi:hypothetical protein
LNEITCTITYRFKHEQPADGRQHDLLSVATATALDRQARGSLSPMKIEALAH